MDVESARILLDTYTSSKGAIEASSNEVLDLFRTVVKNAPDQLGSDEDMLHIRDMLCTNVPNLELIADVDASARSSIDPFEASESSSLQDGEVKGVMEIKKISDRIQLFGSQFMEEAESSEVTMQRKKEEITALEKEIENISRDLAEASELIEGTVSEQNIILDGIAEEGDKQLAKTIQTNKQLTKHAFSFSSIFFLAKYMLLSTCVFLFAYIFIKLFPKPK